MNIREWIADNIGYRFFGCCYNATTQPLFDYLATIAPKEFFHKHIADLGCGDGTNTLRIQKIFQAKSVVGYERNDFLIDRAIKKGLRVYQADLNTTMPKGEMATFILSLHHFHNKERVLEQAMKHFRYIVVCEPIQDLYHILFDAGRPLSRVGWVRLFDNTLKRYQLFEFPHTIIAFYQRASI